jgi:hypothetical protein
VIPTKVKGLAIHLSVDKKIALLKAKLKWAVRIKKIGVSSAHFRIEYNLSII